MKFNLILADPPYNFSDKLTMSTTKRGAASNYSVLKDQDIIDLNIEQLAADDAVLFLWVPSSKLETGIKIMESWGFRQTQTFVWVKIKNDPFKDFKKSIKLFFKKQTIILEKTKKDFIKDFIKNIKLLFKNVNIFSLFDNFDFNTITRMNLGRWFRQCHEIALVGVRGKIYSELKNKSQRSVLFNNGLKHSSKPLGVQERLEQMLPGSNYSKLELFARNDRVGWVSLGNEVDTNLLHFPLNSPPKEDIRDAIDRIQQA